MSAPMTPDRLAEILARRAEAVQVSDLADWPIAEYKLIKQTLTDMTSLLAEVDRLRARVERSGRARLLAEYETRTVVREREALRARVEELVAQRDDTLVELVTGQAPPEALSPWERAVAGLNALVDAGVDFHVEPDGHISAPFSDEHIEWDLKARRWVLTHDDEDGAL